MNILELDSYNLSDAVKFNDKLNPRIWQDNKMRQEVRQKLLEIAEDFKEFLGLSDLDVKDITVSGSNAGYSYTPQSDIDLHLVVDIPQADADEVYRELFDAKKYQYNDLHDITIGGYDVELYVENANKSPVSQGMFSVLNNDWINIPRQRRATVDDDAVCSKYEDLKHRIESAIGSNNFETIAQLVKKIKSMRQAGLDTHGELGPENLAYKMLRTQGYIQKLYNARNASRDQELSLKEKAVKPQRITYGFKTPTVEDVGMSWDGVSPSTKMFLSETQTDEEVLQDFIEFCVKELKINKMPTIKLRRDPQWSVVNKTFGRYIDDSHTLEVAFGQRHIMDVLRTVAHELTHKHQHEREGDRMGPDAGETGSPYENEANARAGILMRDYGRLHPELFDAGQTELGEGASGYIPTKKQAKDPRWSMALTQDIKPGQLGKEANKLKLKTDKQGHPQVARANGLFENLFKEYRAYKADEDYSPDNPPGPEFKPTMPKGTVRVDVSDMYDWYKIGKSISDLKSADKTQFGKGPPSTIISFGDEETEHKYINDLENLGLTTTDIDPVDPKQPKGMKRQKVDPTYNVNESQLDEVSMRPSSLKQFAMSPEAEGIQAGFEAELIFRDTINADDGEDMEPDYDADERVRSIQDVIDFFNGGDYGGLSQRQENALQNGLDEQYMEWLDEQMYDAFRDEADDLVREIWLEDRPMGERIHAALVDGLDLSDEEADRIQAVGGKAPKFTSSSDQEAYAQENADYETYIQAVELADEILNDDVEQSVSKQDGVYDQALDNFREDFSTDDSDFFSDIGLRWMSDVASEYNLDWPYLTGSSNSGSRDWENIADSLNQVVDMPVKVSSGYHSTTRKPGLWIVEPDSSLQPDDSDDYGLEIVSPPMPLAQALEKLQAVTDWANSDEGDAYTNSSTGLHMGVSIPYKGGNVDYLKLILFLGDEYVLKQYGREANTYTKAAMRDIKTRAGTEKNATGVMELLKNNLIELAERELVKSTGESKYTSAHKQDKYIEFRSAGGDWLAEDNAYPGKLESTMMRYAYAMYLAGRPDLERREYAKKLYKLVAPEGGDSSMALFSQLAAGELDKEQFKKRWAEKVLNKEAPETMAKNNWVVVDNNTGKTVPTQEYNGYTEAEVRERAKAKLSPASSDRDFDQAYSIHPKETGKWEVYRDDQGQDETLEIIDADRRGEAVDIAYDKYTGVIPFKVRAYYGDEPATPEKELSPRAKLAKRITAPKPTWNVVYRPTGRVIDQIINVDRKEAESLLSRVAQQHDFENADELELHNAKDAEKAIDQQTAQDRTRYRDWEFFRTETGNVIDTVSDLDQMQANAVRQDIVRRYGHADTSVGMRPVGAVQDVEPDVAQNFSTNTNPTIPDANQVRMPNGVPVWEIYQRDNGHVIHTFADHTQREAWGQAQGWMQGMSVEDPSLFSVRPKLLQPGERNTAGEHTPATSGSRPIPSEPGPNGEEPNYELIMQRYGTPLKKFYAASHPEAMDYLSNYRRTAPGAPSEYAIRNMPVTENFADGKGPGRPGDSQRHGIPKGATIAQLEKAAKAPGRKGELARWQLNMRRGKAKAK